jgi:hypothetical protein
MHGVSNEKCGTMNKDNKIAGLNTIVAGNSW